MPYTEQEVTATCCHRAPPFTGAFKSKIELWECCQQNWIHLNSQIDGYTWNNMWKLSKHNSSDNSTQINWNQTYSSHSQFSSYHTLPPLEPEDIKTPTLPVLGLMGEKSKARLSILVPEVKCQFWTEGSQLLHSLSQDVAVLPRAAGHYATMAWFPHHASVPWFQSHLHCSIIAWCGCHGIMTQFWHLSIVMRLWHHTIVLWWPSCSHVSSTRFHCPWAHTYCLPDLVILVSTLQTHSSIASPWCTSSPWPNASGAKKL